MALPFWVFGNFRDGVLLFIIIHLYCLAVQAGIYSDVVECSTLDQRVPGLILTRGMESPWQVNPHFDQSFARLGHVKTPINRSQDLGNQDSNKPSQVIGISVLRLIIRKTWAYQLRHDQSFARLGLIKIPINHSQDFGISRLRSIITRLGHIKTLINHLQDLGISKHMPIMSWIC